MINLNKMNETNSHDIVKILIILGLTLFIYLMVNLIDFFLKMKKIHIRISKIKIIF